MTEGSVAAVPSRFGALLAAEGWIVLYVDDFSIYREWERLANQIRNKLANPAELREQIRDLYGRAFVEALPVLAWAVRSRAGESDEIVPLVPWMNRVGPADEIVTQRQMIRLVSVTFLDEDERRMLTRDGILRRKLEWYAEKVAE
ncbi:MAG: hypothetical protein JNK67_23755 [Alphaproteobacteria bacterium]|nr:hypothetical protein [Alphaproteobacteria bacterium]